MQLPPKQKRYVYEKSFGLSNVLQNLQGYKLATGEINPAEFDSARVQYGDDEGKVYGALISRAGLRGAGLEGEGASRWKRRKMHRHAHREAREKPRSGQQRKHKHDTPVGRQAGHLLPPDQSESGSAGSHGNQPHREGSLSQADIGSLGLLCCYGDSSGSEGEEGGKEDGRQRGGEERFEVPEVIQGMFERPSVHHPSRVSEASNGKEEGEEGEGQGEEGEGQGEEGEGQGEDNEGEEEEDLGFFRPADTDSDSEEHHLPPPIRAVGVGRWEEPGGGARWDSTRNKWLFPPSALSTHQCWKCSKVGHLPQDCTVRVGGAKVKCGGNEAASLPRISLSLQQYYKRCRELKGQRGARCAECGVHSNIVCCLECGSLLCDGRGHLAGHLLEHLSHDKLFSYKLGRMIKCCKASCEVVSIYELLTCSHCLSKAFSQHYSMINATWSKAGLKMIPNALCCEDHIHWHRMNCPSTSEEPLVTVANLREQSGAARLISEFFF